MTELLNLEQEYIQLRLADLTDDIDCSPSTLQDRDKRLEEIANLVDEELVQEWDFEAQKLANKFGTASGFDL